MIRFACPPFPKISSHPRTGQEAESEAVMTSLAADCKVQKTRQPPRHSLGQG